MVPFLVAMMMAPSMSSLPEQQAMMHDRVRGTTPVTDKDLRHVKPPDCKTDDEAQKAIAQVRNGEAGDCFVRDPKAFSHR